MRILVLVLGVMVFDAANAAAGKILFVAGSVSIERGPVKPATVGDPIEVGDVIVTGAKSRAQLLMADGGKFAIRASSRFRIDGFALAPGVNTPQASVTAADGLFAASLLKGGFRTMSGAIGKTDPKAYEVRTPIGTLGIRGTDYWALFCRGDCTNVPGVVPGNPVRDGLYLGVNAGSIAFRNGRLEIVLKAPEFVFIPLADANPEPLQTAPQFLLEDETGKLQVNRGASGTRSALSGGTSDFNDRRSPPADTTGKPPGSNPNGTAPPGGNAPSLPVGGTDPNGRPVDLTTGILPQQPPQRRDIAYTPGSILFSQTYTDVQSNTPSEYALDSGLNLTSFLGQVNPGNGFVPAQFDQGTATTVEGGVDTVSEIRWGRWAGGIATIATPGAPTPLDLTKRSLHWVMSGNADQAPIIPTVGIGIYTLIGSTSPTDSAGGSGTLGAATLTADFGQQTVQSTLNITMPTGTWSANGAGQIGVRAGQPLLAQDFAGNYVVNFTPAAGQSLGGSGGFAGFFAGKPVGAAGVPAGAGLTFSLVDDAGQNNVSGAAVFHGN